MTKETEKKNRTVKRIAEDLVELTGLKDEDIILDSDVDNCIMIYDEKMENDPERFSELKAIIIDLVEEKYPEMKSDMNIINHGNSCGIYF